MLNKQVNVVRDEVRQLLTLSPSGKLWHTPFLAAACVGLPLLVAYYFNQVAVGMLMCTGAFVILYLPPGNLGNKIKTLLYCTAGFSISFALGLVCGFSRPVSLVALAVFTFFIHFLVNYLKVHPPGSFLFIMLFAVAICIPYNPESIPVKVLLLCCGSLIACLLAFIYYLFFLKKINASTSISTEEKTFSVMLVDSGTLAIFVGLSLSFAEALGMNKPYWIPVSCASVMQGATIRHMWQRSFQRILGTTIGILLAWILLLFHPTVLGICVIIIVLQFWADTFIGRHYALVVVFFTPIAIFLAEAGSGMQQDVDELMKARLLDTMIGAAFGLAGGYFLHLKLWRKILRFNNSPG